MQSAAWTTRIGSIIKRAGEPLPADVFAIPPEAGGKGKNAALTAALEKIRSAQATDARPASEEITRSETGEITIDTKRAVLAIDTPKSAGGCASAGQGIAAPTAGVEVDELTTDATVFVNSLDGAPIRSSQRLLVTHLTDLQNTDCRYGEGSRQTLLAWGKLPHLVREGTARICLSVARPETLSVWSLSVSGRRISLMESSVVNGRLLFIARVNGQEGAQMLYEIAPK